MSPETWTKSSGCDTQTCVEVMWKKSTKSNNNGACVEVRSTDDEIQVRDSKNPSGSVLSFTPAEWDAFLDGAKKGEFDLA